LAILDQLLETAGRRQKERLSGQFSLFDLDDEIDEGIKLPELPDFQEREILDMEKEYLGLYLSGHPLSSVLPIIKPYTNSDILTCLEGEEEKKVALGGLVTGFRQNVTKKGEMMASFVLEDLTGGIEVLVFPRVYAQIQTMLRNDQVIVVVGRYNIRDEEKKIFAEKITKLEDLKPCKKANSCEDSVFVDENKPISLPKIPGHNASRKRLFLRFPNDKCEQMQTILSILQRYPGSEPVYFFFENNQKVLEGKREFWVSDGDELMKTLNAVMGQGNVVWKVAKNFA